MKIVTLCVVGGKNEEYVESLLQSCVFIKEDLEILVLEDERPFTTRIKQYNIDHPESIRIIPTETLYDVSEAVREARGLYFKVINAEHKLEVSTLLKALETMKDLMRIQANLDLLICDVTERQGKKQTKFKYDNAFPLDKVFKWHQAKDFKGMQKLSIESLFYKTNILKKLEIGHYDRKVGYESLLIRSIPKTKCLYYLNQSIETIYRNRDYEYTKRGYNTIGNWLEAAVKEVHLNDIDSRKLRNCIVNQIHVMCLQYAFYYSQIEEYYVPSRMEELVEYIQIEKPELYKQLRKMLSARVYLSKHKITKKVLLKKYCKD